MSNVFGVKSLGAGERTYTLADIVPNHSMFVPIDQGKSVAVVLHVSKPIDGELFYLSWRGERLFRRLTRIEGQLTLVSKTRRFQIPEEEQSQLEIIGRVMFLISFPNQVSDEMIAILNKLVEFHR